MLRYKFKNFTIVWSQKWQTSRRFLTLLLALGTGTLTKTQRTKVEQGCSSVSSQRHMHITKTWAAESSTVEHVGDIRKNDIFSKGLQLMLSSFLETENRKQTRLVQYSAALPSLYSVGGAEPSHWCGCTGCMNNNKRKSPRTPKPFLRVVNAKPLMSHWTPHSAPPSGCIDVTAKWK